MHIHEKIERLEKAIVDHYTNKMGERRLGWTKLKDMQQMVDYTVNDENEWSVEYMKRLMNMADELKISVKERA